MTATAERPAWEASAKLMSAPTVAAVTLDPHGGGIASVSRMVWHVLEDAWPDSRLVTLVAAPEGPRRGRPGLPARLRFGTDILRRQLSEPDGWVVFTHLALAQAQAFVPRTVRRPYAVFLHGIEAWRPLAPSARRALEGAALLIANSRHTASRVRATNPGAGDIQVCPLAIDPEVVGIASNDEPGTRRRGGGPSVLMVGRMDAAERYKGHDQVIEAWPMVRACVPDARLSIVGDGDDRNRLEKKAAALGLADVVEFTGFVSDETRAALYDRAWVFALPSLEEGFGLVYLEAMARQLPCVASRQDAASEIVEDGVTGYLVDQTDIAGLASRLTHLLSDAQIRRAMGRAGRARVCGEYTYGRFRDRLLSILAGARLALSHDRQRA